MNLMEPRFPIGNTYATADLTSWAERKELDLTKLMWRHNCGDWGNLDDEDKQANEEALKRGSRIFSCYLNSVWKIYCMAKSNRSSTALLFTEELLFLNLE